MKKEVMGSMMIKNLIHRLEESSRLDAMLKEDLDVLDTSDIDSKKCGFEYEQNEIVDILFESDVSTQSKSFINRMGIIINSSASKKIEESTDIFDNMRKSILKIF